MFIWLTTLEQTQIENERSSESRFERVTKLSAILQSYRYFVVNWRQLCTLFAVHVERLNEIAYIHDGYVEHFYRERGRSQFTL